MRIARRGSTQGEDERGGEEASASASGAVDCGVLISGRALCAHWKLCSSTGAKCWKLDSACTRIVAVVAVAVGAAAICCFCVGGLYASAVGDVIMLTSLFCGAAHWSMGRSSAARKNPPQP